MSTGASIRKCCRLLIYWINGHRWMWTMHWSCSVQRSLIQLFEGNWTLSNCNCCDTKRHHKTINDYKWLLCIFSYAITRLKQAPDDDLVLYLLQLVQALKYENFDEIEVRFSSLLPQLPISKSFVSQLFFCFVVNVYRKPTRESLLIAMSSNPLMAVNR